MHFDLSEDQELLRDSVRTMARQEILPAAEAIDASGEFPWEQVQSMCDMGLMGIAIPEQWGGAGMDHVAYAVAIEEISAACGSCGVIMSVNNSLVGDPIKRFGTDAQKEQWLKPVASGEILGAYALSEPGTGSDAAAQQTVARRDGEGWILTGAKNFITNGAQAKVIIVFAMGDMSLGVKGINAYLVPTDAPGFSVAKNEKKLGIKGSSTSQIQLDDIKLGPEALLGKEGEGFKIAMSTLDGGRIGIAAQALGIARQAFEEARDYSLERVTFGKPIAEHQAIQFKLADMATEIDAARLLIWQAAYLKDKGARFGPAAAKAKLYASEMSRRVTNEALQVFGGYGYCMDFPAERHLRDARITEIYEGTSEIQRMVIARSVLSEH